MFTERIVILILFAAILVVADQLAKEKMIRSRMRRCARQFSLAMNFQCRGITAEECEAFRELFGLETSNVSLREHLVEKKCCERRCSLQVLRSLCCFE